MRWRRFEGDDFSRRAPLIRIAGPAGGFGQRLDGTYGADVWHAGWVAPLCEWRDRKPISKLHTTGRFVGTHKGEPGTLS